LLAQSSSTNSHPLGGAFVEDVPGHRVVDRLALVVYRDDVSPEPELVISLHQVCAIALPAKSTMLSHSGFGKISHFFAFLLPGLSSAGLLATTQEVDGRGT
jgi:hypothetical protein